MYLATASKSCEVAPVLNLKENALKIQAATASPQKAITQSRSVLVPAVPEAFVYDLDGNLLQGGLWTYEWDADVARQRGDGAPKARLEGCRVRVPLGRTRQQNRLTAQELRSDVSTTTWKRLEYGYDREGRRIRKLVKTKTSPSGTWTTASDTRFLYDGWNLIAEYTYALSTFTLLRSHAWGLDLSGSAQGAGGVGGLLWTTVAATAKTYAAAADANGNVIAYVDLADGAIAGKRDYGAFGEALVITGVAGSLPFGFSTKYEEKETGLLYYGFRYYNPSVGRWSNRDSFEENGGLNLYCVVSNNAIYYYDTLGLAAGDVYPSRDSAIAAARIEIYGLAKTDARDGRSALESAFRRMFQSQERPRYLNGVNYAAKFKLGADVVMPEYGEWLKLMGREYGAYVYCVVEGYTYTLKGAGPLIGRMPSSTEMDFITGTIDTPPVLTKAQIDNKEYADPKFSKTEVCGLEAFLHTHVHETEGYPPEDRSIASGGDKEYARTIGVSNIVVTTP
jgi:RHS repeat-associated protein